MNTPSPTLSLSPTAVSLTSAPTVSPISSPAVAPKQISSPTVSPTQKHPDLSPISSPTVSATQKHPGLAMNLPSRAPRRVPTAMENEISDEVVQLDWLEQIKVDQDVGGRNLLAAAEPSHLTAIGLRALDKKIEKELKSMENDAMAARLRGAWASDRSLRLKMLRAENFDSDLAYHRLVNYLKLIQEVLGDGHEPRQLELARDFDDSERSLLEGGALQLLLFRDHTGRRVAGCFDVDTPPGKTPPSEVCKLAQASTQR